MNSTNNFIYNVTEWITRFAYINILWILFTLIGGVLFGFYPATIAMFAITRDWLRGNTDKPILKSFWAHYKNDFLKSNILGLIINILIIISALDVYFILRNTNESIPWTYIPLFAFIFLFLLFIFYCFPAFVHYDSKVRHVIKNAFLIMLINPVHSFLILLCLVSIFFIMKIVPPLAFIFGGSSYAFITMWISLHAFNKMNRKNASHNRIAS